MQHPEKPIFDPTKKSDVQALANKGEILNQTVDVSAWEYLWP